MLVHLRIVRNFHQQAGYQLSGTLAIMLIDLLLDVRKAIWVVLKLLSPLVFAGLRLYLKHFDSVGRGRDGRPVF